MNNKSTTYMQDYIQEVFDIVIELYKEVAPELLSKALKIDFNNIEELNSKDIMKLLDNLKINYEIVENADDERIWYSDSVNQKLLSKILGKNIPYESDELRLHLYEPEVLEMTSVEEIKKSRSKDGMSKIISDINFISHEMAHALGHLIKIDNPSYIDSTMYLAQNSKNMINYDIGESFAVSMERIILDKLSEKGQLEKYGLDKYANISDIEDVWQKKRIIPFSQKGNIGKNTDGQYLGYLDLNLEPYKFIKENGMRNTVECIEKFNLFDLAYHIPNKNDSNKINEFLIYVSNKEYINNLIPNKQFYKSFYSDIEIFDALNKLQSQKPENENVSAQKRKIDFLRKRKVNTPLDIEANEQISRDIREQQMAKEEAVHSDYGD